MLSSLAFSSRTSRFFAATEAGSAIAVEGRAAAPIMAHPASAAAKPRRGVVAFACRTVDDLLMN